MATSQRLKLPLLLIIFTVLLTIFYIHHSSYYSPSHDSLTLNDPSSQNTISGKDSTSFILNPIDAPACGNVDITWLASD
ncbi:unnamed protein product [Absidia cylindrospora]